MEKCVMPEKKNKHFCSLHSNKNHTFAFLLPWQETTKANQLQEGSWKTLKRDFWISVVEPKKNVTTA